MLTCLKIQNVAVIREAEINFTEGFCALTGETGAGKSILIDSLSAVLGGRASKDLVRKGSDKATVSALFEEVSPAVCELVEELGFSAEDGTLLLNRTITADGRSTCRINGSPANTAVLRSLAVNLVNIHGQQDNHSLLDASGHVQYIDKLCDNPELVFRYRSAYTHWRKLQEQLSSLHLDEAEKARRVDMLTYQVEELRAANLQVGEYEHLQNRQKTAANAEKIASALANTLAYLGGDENNPGAVTLTQNSANAFAECAKYLEDSDKADLLWSLSYELEALYDEVRDVAEDLVFDPRELAEIEERLDVLYRLSRKYGQDEEQMLAFLEKAEEELASLNSVEQNQKALEEAVAKAEQQAMQLAKELSDARQATALQFDKAVGEELAFLNMPGVVFATAFTPCELTSGGGEKIEFLISANPGEPPKPLSKIASGGELSRIMLAIISVLTGKDEVDTLIFDEIDAGISGRAALKVGGRLKQTAVGRQVICITHLAQIAAKANTHYLIEKSIDGQQAVTSVTRLTKEQRLQELARIIGGEVVTPASLQTAKELVEAE